MDKRYQIFVSSTFRDLIPERAAVINAILSLDHIPAGMELFPSTTDMPWELITGVIDLSDYYILIIAGVYGSTTAAGISYTESEYDYAISTGKSVLVFVHANPMKRPGELLEFDADARDKLNAFREKVQAKHTRTAWNDAADLKVAVLTSLVSEFRRHPAVGWVRADGINDTELLKRNAELNEDNKRLRDDNDRLR